MRRRRELVEQLIRLWLDLTKEPLCVIVEGKHDASIISLLPAHTKPLVFEVQRLGLYRTLEAIRTSGVKRVLVLTDFDVKGYRLARSIISELQRLGVMILSEARERIYRIFMQLRLRHIEQLAEFADDFEKYTPFSLFLEKLKPLSDA